MTDVIIGFNHDTLSDGSGKAGITMRNKYVIMNYSEMNDASSTDWWSNSNFRTDLNTTYFYTLPETLQNCIKKVDKLSGKQDGSLGTTQDLLWLFSPTELGVYSSMNDYVIDGQGECYADVFDGTKGTIKMNWQSGTGWTAQYATRQRATSAGYSIGVNVSGNVVRITDSSKTGALFGFCV